MRFSRLNKLISFSISSPGKCSRSQPSWWPSTEPTAICQCLSGTGRPKTGHSSHNECWLLEDNVFLQSTSYAPVNIGQDAVGLFCHGKLLAYDLLAVHQDPQILFSRASPQLENPQHLSLWEVTPSIDAGFCIFPWICRDILWWNVKMQNIRYT